MEVDAKKSVDCIPLDEASLKIYDNMIKVRSRMPFTRSAPGFARHACEPRPAPILPPTLHSSHCAAPRGIAPLPPSRLCR